MKKNFLLLFALLVSLAGTAQTLKIVNNTRSVIAFQVTASDKSNNCNAKYTSATTSIPPAGVLNYKSPSDIIWSAEPKNGAQIVYSYFNGIYADATGSRVAKSGNIGETACGLKKTGSIDLSKCGSSGSININWSSENGNVTVTIN